MVNVLDYFRNLRKLKNPSWSGGILGTANFETLSPVSENGISYLPIKYDFPFGDGENLTMDSALVKPFKKLLNEGELPGKTSFLFYDECGDHYTVGSIFYTGKRLIFFPALKPTMITESPLDKQKIQKTRLNVDHLTIDKPWNKWHFSFKQNKEKKKQKITIRNTKKLNDSTILWFVLAIQHVNKLEKMPKSQIFNLIFPNFEELQRRFDEFIESRHGSEFPIMKVLGNPKENWYLNLEFFICDKNSDDYKKDPPKTSTVFNANHYSNNKENPIIDLNTREHPIHLPSFEKRLWIRVSRMPGILNQEAYFLPGSDF